MEAKSSVNLGLRLRMVFFIDVLKKEKLEVGVEPSNNEIKIQTCWMLLTSENVDNLSIPAAHVPMFIMIKYVEMLGGGINGRFWAALAMHLSKVVLVKFM